MYLYQYNLLQNEKVESTDGLSQCQRVLSQNVVVFLIYFMKGLIFVFSRMN